MFLSRMKALKGQWKTFEVAAVDGIKKLTKELLNELLLNIQNNFNKKSVVGKTTFTNGYYFKIFFLYNFTNWV